MNGETLEQRVERLEKIVTGLMSNATTDVTDSKKQLSLSELASSKLITNGQQKIVTILGHNELILRGEPLGMPEIRKAWTLAKFDLKPDPKQLERAIKAGLVRDAENSKKYDLTRKGEAYFHSVREDVDHD